MKNRIVAFCFISIFAIVVIFVAFTALRQDAQGQKKDSARFTKLPQILSKISSLELLTSRIENEGSPDAVVVLKMRNNSDKSIIAVAIESGDDKERSGTTLNGFNDGDEPPTIIVGPYENFEARMPLANVRPGFPIHISGVLYSDGSEDGNKGSLETIHRQKEHYKSIGKVEPKR